MKKFKIISDHDVYEYSYSEGEGNNVNYYQLSDTIEASNAGDALKKYFAEVLHYPFEHDDNNDGGDVIYYDILVNGENEMADEDEVNDWTLGAIQLYNNRVSIQMFEMVPIRLIL